MGSVWESTHNGAAVALCRRIGHDGNSRDHVHMGFFFFFNFLCFALFFATFFFFFFCVADAARIVGGDGDIQKRAGQGRKGSREETTAGRRKKL